MAYHMITPKNWLITQKLTEIIVGFITCIIIIILIRSGVKIARVKSKVKSRKKAEVVAPRR